MPRVGASHGDLAQATALAVHALARFDAPGDVDVRAGGQTLLGGLMECTL